MNLPLPMKGLHHARHNRRPEEDKQLDPCSWEGRIKNMYFEKEKWTVQREKGVSSKAFFDREKAGQDSLQQLMHL